MKLLTALGPPPPSYARVREPSRPPLRVGAVQHRWHPDPQEHEAALAEGIRLAAQEGATLVCLQELTLSPYFAVTPDGPREPEEVPGGRTTRFAARMAAETGAHVHASLYERADGDDGLGYNTAIVVAPSGDVVAVKPNFATFSVSFSPSTSTTQPSGLSSRWFRMALRL